MIALVGSGEYLPPMEAVDRELIKRLAEPARVVCLPTAAGTEGEAIINGWSDKGVDYFRRLGVTVEAVPVIDATTANDPDLADTVAQANFVYLSGGKPGYLYESLVNSLTWQAIEGVLARGGILVGCSAGAMIQGQRILGFPHLSPGFGLLANSVIAPHYDEFPDLFTKSIRLILSNNLTLVGVEGNTALFKQRDHLEVIGSGGVTIWNQQEKTRYAAGPIPTSSFLMEANHE